MEYRLASSSWGKEEINSIQEVIDSDMFSIDQKLKNLKSSLLNFSIQNMVM